MREANGFSCSLLFYGKLLHLYPQHFRDRFGHEMLQIFALQLSDAKCRAGAIGVAKLWLATIAELLATTLVPQLQMLSEAALPAVLGVVLSALLFAGALAFFESIASAASTNGHLVNVGDHRLFLDCTGPSTNTTVILESGMGGNSTMWSKVQSQLSTSTRVCSYDRAGEGQSDKAQTPQTPTTIAQDLHRLLAQQGITSPYILVGASLGGIYVRSFTELYPEAVSGLVLVDSSHEEQYSHYFAISPSVALRFATQDGRFREEDTLRVSGQLPAGQHLNWHYHIPLIVLEHKRPGPEGAQPWPGQSRGEAIALADGWHQLQVDLASRSKFGELRETKSGHSIEGEQPEAVVSAVHDVLAEAAKLKHQR